jgi:hypothetical protein
MENGKSVSIVGLILVPALITLAITIVRLVGELEHWSPLLFSTKAGGGMAIVGISWLPILFGPYFAWKLAGAGEGPGGYGKAIGMAILALVIVVGCLAWAGTLFKHPTLLLLVPFLLIAVAAFIPGAGWGALNKTLLAYALSARIPVLVVMFLAMHGNGGAGWGTHYDAVEETFAHLPFALKYLYMAVLPQMTMWIAWTTIIGGLLGSIVAGVGHRGKQPAQATA